jgi:germination protein M
MKKKNVPLAIMIGIFAMTAFVLVYAFAVDKGKPRVDDSMRVVGLYFVNSAQKTIEREERTMPLLEAAEMTQALLGLYMEGSTNPILEKPLPASVDIIGESALITDHKTQDVTFQVDFTEAYLALPPLDEALLRSAFVWTMTELDCIDNVLIYVNGKKLVSSRGESLEGQNRNNVYVEPPLSPIINKTVKLYFSNEDGTALVPETRVIELTPDLQLEPFIVEQIIKGPLNAGCFATISPDVKVRTVTTDEGVCYVNLSQEFLTKIPASSASAKIMVYSIVNSLMELSNVKKVKFMVETQFLTEPFHTLDLSVELIKDDSLVAGI